MRLEAVPILTVLLSCSSVQTSLDIGQPTTTTEENVAKARDLLNAIFNHTLNEEVSEDCYGEGQEVGKCVKKSMCDIIPPEIDKTADDCGFPKICCPPDKLRTDPVPPPPAPAPGCGYSNHVAQLRAGGEDSGYAGFAEFPWMVALLKNRYKEWTSASYIGGGTLIHPAVVLTTAHKVNTYKPSDLTVRAGEWDTENTNEELVHQERAVREIIVHDQFVMFYADNDVALLYMAKPFDIQAHINVACLSRSLPAPGTVCYSMGWGQEFTEGKFYASVLKKVTLPLMQREECERRFRSTRLGPGYTLHRSLLCTGGQANVDTCIGDGGSPLVCPIGETAELRYAVVGMAVYWLECRSTFMPGLYANVPEAYEWIGKQLRLEGIDGTPYVY